MRLCNDYGRDVAEMSRVQQLACRSAPWRAFAGRVVLPWALQHEQLQGDVLEIGCGSGAMAVEMLERYPAIRLTATDYDAAMVRVASERLARFGARVVVRQADATALALDDSAFDTVVTFIMLHHVMEWEAALGEAARVLKPGGRLIGYDLVADGVGAIGAHGHGTRRMHMHELSARLRELPFTSVNVKKSRTTLVVRFAATRVAQSAD